jgi:hypothetical protein
MKIAQGETLGQRTPIDSVFRRVAAKAGCPGLAFQTWATLEPQPAGIQGSVQAGTVGRGFIPGNPPPFRDRGFNP